MAGKFSKLSEYQSRRNFIQTIGAGALGVSGLSFGMHVKYNENRTQNTGLRLEKLKRIASNSFAVNQLFRRRSMRQRAPRPNPYKDKYGEITMLDFPQFTKDTYPGVNAMDLWSSLFGDVNDDSMFTQVKIGDEIRFSEFDPSSASSKKYLDQLANNMVKTGVQATHISNNAPRNLADTDEALRKEGIRVGKIWLDAAKQIGVRSMRVNTGGPRIIPEAVIEGGYPQNNEIVPYIEKAIESFKELAGYAEKTGVKVTIENHWGLAANPVNILIILNEVNSPYCESSPDFCNWEHKYMLYHGLEMLIPKAHSMVHAKRWTRFPDVDIAHCVKILNNAGYKGYVSVEYEGGGDPVEGTLKLMEDVVEGINAG